MKQAQSYDRAVALLVDLREVHRRAGEPGVFDERLTELRRLHTRKPALLSRLDAAGLRD